MFGLDISHFLSFVVHLIENCTRKTSKEMCTQSTCTNPNAFWMEPEQYKQTHTRKIQNVKRIHKKSEKFCLWLLSRCVFYSRIKYLLAMRTEIVILEQSVSKMWHILPQQNSRGGCCCCRCLTRHPYLSTDKYGAINFNWINLILNMPHYSSSAMSDSVWLQSEEKLWKSFAILSVIK